MSLVSKRGVVYCERPALPCPALPYISRIRSFPTRIRLEVKKPSCTSRASSQHRIYQAKTIY
jgi:hypothetical protein